MPRLLSRERIIAKPGFNRWLVPPAALAIHLCIGQVYAFSVFKLPLTKAIGITASAPGDWTQPQLAWIFTLAIVFLGLSAATFGEALARASRASEKRRGLGNLLGGRIPDLRRRRPDPHHLVDLSGLRRDRRLRAGDRVHHPGIYADQVVP